MSDALILIGLTMFVVGILVGVITTIVFIVKKRKNIGKPLLIWFIYLLISFLMMYIGANIPEQREEADNTDVLLEDNILSQEKTEKTDEDVTIVSDSTYTVDGQEFRIYLSTQGDELKLNVSGNASNFEKASWMLAVTKSKFEELGDLINGYSINVHVNDLYVLYMNNGESDYCVGTNIDGSTVLSVPDWVGKENKMSEQEVEDFADEIFYCIQQFGANNNK